MSQHLISWIQVGGLILGLYGFFLLSYETLSGKTGPWFAAFLPATAVCIGAVALLGALDNPSNNLLFLFAPNNAATLARVRATIPEYGLAGFVFGYVYSVYQLLTTPKTPRVRFLALRLALVFVLASLVGVGLVALLYVNFWSGGGSLSGFLVISGTMTLLILGESLAATGPMILSRESLPKWGFALTAIAILTQFIPPVLDVLNIAVTKP